ncbi:MAG: D-alanine--D-alanine ligase [Pseudomonadota bacterium]
MSGTSQAMVVRPGARVAVLLGGMSAERDISLKSGKAVAGALRRRCWDTVEIDVGPDLPERLRAEDIDVAWIALHGRYGEDGCVQGLLEIMGIPYTGSGAAASAVAMDKLLTKKVLAGSDLALAEQWVLGPGDAIPAGLPLPLVAKTPTGGSTLGISFCHTPEELRAGVADCRRHGETVLLERFVTGDEITVAVLDGQALPVVAIRPEGGVFDFEAKYQKGKTRYIVPADVPAVAAARAQRDALTAVTVLGLAGVCRADFIVDRDGVPWFLEVNTIPGMTETSLSPMAAAEVGISFDDLVERVLMGARLHLRPATP